jgi:metal-responsive CopG/Arc/MetJ family transcriptional regulator
MELDDRLGVLLPKTIKEQLIHIAEKKSLKMSDIIREAFREYIDKFNSKSAKEKYNNENT